MAWGGQLNLRSSLARTYETMERNLESVIKRRSLVGFEASAMAASTAKSTKVPRIVRIGVDSGDSDSDSGSDSA